jgi:Uncharacterized protein conserved in bacteria (DUF2188)
MAKKSTSATKKSSSKTSAKKAETKTIHVVARIGGWAIRSEGHSRATSVHSTQKEAVEAARALAKKAAGALVIHGRDGRVQSRDSYSKDPLPPREPRKVLFPMSTPRTTSKEAIMRAVSDTVNETKGSSPAASKGDTLGGSEGNSRDAARR